jgi:hypothetical protein
MRQLPRHGSIERALPARHADGGQRRLFQPSVVQPFAVSGRQEPRHQAPIASTLVRNDALRLADISDLASEDRPYPTLARPFLVRCSCRLLSPGSDLASLAVATGIAADEPATGTSSPTPLPRCAPSSPETVSCRHASSTGGRLVTHARYYWLLLAESHLTRRLFGQMLQRIWALPVPTG